MQFFFFLLIFAPFCCIAFVLDGVGLVFVLVLCSVKCSFRCVLLLLWYLHMFENRCVFRCMVCS